MARQEDFVFAERVLHHGYATEDQVQECLSLLGRLRAEMGIEESLRGLMLKKGYLAPAQASILDAEVDPARGRPRNAIEGYRLLERLGSGAMGSVYKAHHVKLDIPVALKVLRPSLASSRTQIERLKREAQLAARLSHPNVVRCLDVGESNGFHYLAMEFVEGRTVRELLAKGPIPEKEALRIAGQVAAGLAHAHGHGVVHRDVKPGNILLAPNGTAKLGDFGLARGEAPSDLTLEHASIGTPQYVAPEQMRRGSDATPRSDLFSLGATLYHMVTGRPPFDGENLGAIVQNVLECRFAPPESVAKDLSRDTVYLIGRLLRANPRERYGSAADLVLDLERIGQGEPIAPGDFVGDYQAFLRKRRTRRTAILAACAVVLAGAAAFGYDLRAKKRLRREREAYCANAAKVGADVTASATLKEISLFIAAMEKAARGASGCDPAAVEPLRKRLDLARHAKTCLESAEEAAAEAQKDGASFVRIVGGIAGLDPGLPAVARRIEEIREDIRRRSTEEATDRHNRLAFHDAREVEAEARAFAKDLKERYIAFAADWRDDVEEAPRFLDAFSKAWKRVDGARGEFEEALQAGRYDHAAARLEGIRRAEEEARRGLFRNAYLKRFSHLFKVPDDRETRLDDAEREAWDKVRTLAQGKMQARPDEAEEALRKFLERAHKWRPEAQTQLSAAAEGRRRLVEKQLGSYAADEQAFRRLLRERAYAKAYEDLAAIAGSARWLEEPKARYDALLDRARAVAKLPQRFLDGARARKTVKIRQRGDVPGKDIERAPGDNPDLFVARRGKERIEFTLKDLERTELEGIFAFDPKALEDRKLSGWFHAAEAFRVDRNPHDSAPLREKALTELPKDDPWFADIEAALDRDRKRAAEGERRAAEAAAELKAAKDGNDVAKQLFLLRELLALDWTDFVKPKRKEYADELARIERVATLVLLPLELGVPESQVSYDQQANPTIRLTGEEWCPVPDAPPDQAAALTRAYWNDWFRKTKGKTDEEEIEDLIARARRQLLAWHGAVEVGPKGGYRPAPDARIRDVGKEWMPPLGATDFVAQKPEPILLANPFRRDRPWSIECEVFWPRRPAYFAIACGQIQAVLGCGAGHGGMKGAALVESDAMDPNALLKQLMDLQWHVVEDRAGRRRLMKDQDKAYLDDFVEGAPYWMKLSRTRDSVVFEMKPLGVPAERQAKAAIRLERRFPDPQKLERLVTLGDGRTLFRFYGPAAPAADAPYELRDVRIWGSLSEKPDVE